MLRSSSGDVMPANLSEGVVQQRCNDCDGVCCEVGAGKGEEKVL